MESYPSSIRSLTLVHPGRASNSAQTPPSLVNTLKVLRLSSRFFFVINLRTEPRTPSPGHDNTSRPTGAVQGIQRVYPEWYSRHIQGGVYPVHTRGGIPAPYQGGYPLPCWVYATPLPCWVYATLLLWWGVPLSPMVGVYRSPMVLRVVSPLMYLRVVSPLMYLRVVYARTYLRVVYARTYLRVWYLRAGYTSGCGTSVQAIPQGGVCPVLYLRVVYARCCT